MFEEYAGDWVNARAQTTGYESENIAETVRLATRNVRDGKSAYERDGVNFNEIEYSWPLLSGLLLAAAESNGSLRVVDVGGSLGSTYFQNRKYLNKLAHVTWSVVEQPRFAEIGSREFSSEELKFYDNFNSASSATNPTVILFGSSLQYFEAPGKMLLSASKSPAQHLILDRTPIQAGTGDLIVLQSVPSSIYQATYPAWLFSRDFLNVTLGQEWELLEEFPALGGTKITDKGTQFSWRGAHFVRGQAHNSLREAGVRPG